MLQHRQKIFELVEEYKLLLKKGYHFYEKDLSYIGLQKKTSKELFAMLQQIFLALREEIDRNEQKENKRCFVLLKKIRAFLDEHIVYQEVIYDTIQHAARLVMEMIQILTYHKGFVSLAQEKHFLEDLYFVNIYGTREQLMLCKTLLKQKKNLLRKVTLQKAVQLLER